MQTHANHVAVSLSNSDHKLGKCLDAMTGDDLGIAGPAQRDVAPGAAAVRSGRPVGLTKQKPGR
jgi:hypothetical protein